jgi:hypothetical protein
MKDFPPLFAMLILLVVFSVGAGDRPSFYRFATVAGELLCKERLSREIRGAGNTRAESGKYDGPNF